MTDLALREPAGREGRLILEHRRLPDRATMLDAGAGWHAHLDILVARVTGGEPAPFSDRWGSPKADDDQRLPA